MSKKTKFLTLAILVAVGRFYDVFTTSLYTPDLKNESNIIVSWFGGGWTIVLTLQALLTAAVIYGLFYHFYKFQTIRPAESNLTLKQYISFFHFNEKDSFWKIFYKTPKNKSGFIAATGYITSMILIFISFIVGTSTTFLIVSDGYKQFYKFGIPYVLHGIICVLVIYFTVRFYKIEYEKYKHGK